MGRLQGQAEMTGEDCAWADWLFRRIVKHGGNRFNPSYKGFVFCKRIEFVGGVPVYLDAARRAGEDSGRRLRGGDEAGETARRGGAATRQG